MTERRYVMLGLKRVFLNHKHHAFTKKQLAKRYRCSEFLVQSVLRELVGQSYVLKIRHGQHVLYTLHPSVRK